jgi:membrane associated rhomboid family serine protease
MYQRQPQIHLTPVVKNLLIINIIVFVATEMLIPKLNGLLSIYYPTSPFFQPYQILSHMFVHHGALHIFMNMIGLVMFGPMIEMVWKEKRFLFYYLFCGLGALALQMAFYYWQIQKGDLSIEEAEMIRLAGASGCLFGLLIAFAMLYPNQYVGIIFLPITMKAKYAAPIYAGIELVMGLGNIQQGVAHFAHLGGALAGFLLIMFWWKGIK